MLTLPAKYEAALIAYIALYFNCSKKTCWRTIGDAIRKFGSKYTGIVYRGHDASNPIIQHITPFFSTSPKREMAQLFVEKNWSTEEGIPIGYLFKIHIVDTPVLNTDQINYTFTDEVISELRKLNGNRKIDKGGHSYTFDEYLPNIKATIHNLVFDRSTTNDQETLVLNGGTFYKSSLLNEEGYNEKRNNNYNVFETWYTFHVKTNTRKQRKRNLKNNTRTQRKI